MKKSTPVYRLIDILNGLYITKIKFNTLNSLNSILSKKLIKKLKKHFMKINLDTDKLFDLVLKESYTSPSFSDSQKKELRNFAPLHYRLRRGKLGE